MALDHDRRCIVRAVSISREQLLLSAIFMRTLRSTMELLAKRWCFKMLPLPSMVAIACRQHATVERQAGLYFSDDSGSPIPRQLVVDLLAEAYSTPSLQSWHAFHGNCLSARSLNNGRTLIAHPTGRANETPAVTVIECMQQVGTCQVDPFARDQTS